MTLKYEPFEVSLTTTNNYANPYLNVNLSAIFNGPNNTVINIEGFWDGDNNYKIRMSPTETGTWNYITTSNDNQLNGKTGNFEVTKSEKKGFIKVNPNHPYSFMYDDSTPFFWMGDTLWTDPGYSNFIKYIDILSQNGYNNYRNYVSRKLKPNEGGLPFVQLTSTTEDHNKLLPNYFIEYDKRVIYANSKNLIPQLVFSLPEDFLTYTRAQFERYEKYIVARYAAYNVVWIICGEYNEQSTPSEYDYHGNIIYQKDPYKHPISIHPTGSTSNSKDFATTIWNTYIMQQMRTDVYNKIINDRIYNKPVVNGEARYLYDGEITVDAWRKQNWYISIAGGYFDTGYQGLFWFNWRDGKPFDLNNPTNLIGMSQMKYLSNFFNATEFWKMSPKNNLVSSGYLLGTNQLGKDYVIYLPNGGSTTVDLSSLPGLLQLEWYNPRTGTYQGQTTVQGGTLRSFTSPDSNDWVLHIYCPTPLCDFTITIT